MKKIAIYTSTLLLLACSPSEEEIKKSLDSKYALVKEIPAENVCSNLEGYKELKEIEDKHSTKFYSDIVAEQLSTYEPLCKEELRKAEEEKRMRKELAKTGDWSKGYYVDEFGDKTKQGFITQSVKGSFSNSATENSDLIVKININDADISKGNPWFRFFEYAGTNPIKGIFDSNTMRCRIKDDKGGILELNLNQSQGQDYLYIKNYRKLNKELLQKFKALIRREGTGNFVCIQDEYGLSKYYFKLNFKYFNNIVRIFSEGS